MPAGRPPRDEVYLRLDAEIGELWTRLGGLPAPAEATEIWRGIWYEEAHHSTAIEGNTLILKQVQFLLAEGRAVGDKQLAEYLEVRGYADAADWVYGQAISRDRWPHDELLTMTEVRTVHELALGPVWDVAPHGQATAAERPGAFRRHDIESFPEGMRPPPWTEVDAAMVDWVRAAQSLEARSPRLPEQLAELHVRFEQVHPFLDGNGRAGRLLLNLMLVRLGYPPAAIYKNQRTAYLRALRRADRGEYGALGEFLARAVLANLYKFVVPAVAGPARLVPLAALASRDVTSGALRVAAVRGKLQAVKGPDGDWRSSRRWVDDYVSNRYRRRPART